MLDFSKCYETSFLVSQTVSIFCDWSIIGSLCGSQYFVKCMFCKAKTFTSPWRNLKRSPSVKPLENVFIYKADTLFFSSTSALCLKMTEQFRPTKQIKDELKIDNMGIRITISPWWNFGNVQGKTMSLRCLQNKISKYWSSS